MSADGEELSSSNDKVVNIEKQLRSLQESLQSHSVKAVNLNPQKSRMNRSSTRFCKFFRTEGQTVIYCPRKQNQSSLQNHNYYRPRQKKFQSIPAEIFVHFKGIKNIIITVVLDHNKLHSKVEIVSLKTEMVFGITFKISSATTTKTHIDKITQGLTKNIQISKIIKILFF